MIAITRRLAKQGATLIRRTLGLSGHAARSQPVRFHAGSGGLLISASGRDHAVAFHDPKPQPPHELVVPLVALIDIADKSLDLVTLVGEKSHVVVRWVEGCVPQSRRYDPIAPKLVSPLPEDTGFFTEQPAELVVALREAFRSTDGDPSRYALGCVQLRGPDGDVGGSDGRQIYLHGGFDFGFPETLLVRRTQAFECVEAFAAPTVELGLCQKHLRVTSAPWTFWLGLDRDGQFPDIDRAIPYVDDETPTMELAPVDAEFLSQNLKRLPRNDAPNYPVTVDLNGHVAVRARGSDAPPTELVLSASRRLGPETRVCIDRRFLQRAAELGFNRVAFSGAETPVVCRDQRRTYVWATLGRDGVVGPHCESTFVESCATNRNRRRRAAA